MKDPQNFLSQYKYSMINQQLDEVHMCKLFPELLIDNARRWFDSLPPSSIDSYAELMDAFYRRFFQKTKSKTTPAHLLTIRQAREESITDFMTRFNQESLIVEDVNDLLIISAFQNGVQPGALHKELIRYEPRTVAELWRVTDRFAKADEADRRKRELGKTEAYERGPKTDDQRGRNDRRDRDRQNRSALDRIQRPPVQSRLGPQRGPLESRLGPHPSQESTNQRGPTQLTKSRADIFGLHADLFEPPRPMLKGGKRRSQNKYCSFHKDHGHDTEDCRNLAASVESLVRDGALKKYQARAHRPPQKKGRKREARGRDDCTPPRDKKARRDPDEEDEEPTHYEGVVETISGLPHGTTRSSLKNEARRVPPVEPVNKRFKKADSISFTEDDPVPAIFPHNDAIIIEVVIANKLVRRVHVDTGASVSVLFKGCYDNLEVGDARLAPAPLPLRSFAQDETRPEGVVSLPVTIGKAPTTSTHSVQFFVVKAASPYNVILGRDWLNAVRAICSTYHLTIKVPTKGGIAVVRGDQQRAKECMQIALRRADFPTQPPQA